MAKDFNAAGELIALAEKELFTGSFSENTIRTDLGSRRGKRDYYIQELEEWKRSINSVLDGVREEQAWDTVLISRCEKCRDQAQKMLDYVQSR
ncbi:MAG: hypothetical protein LBH95_08645 [Oscillospiraceae bacterium]|jgi:hypothetical protein|nr:hypothetical protein [Oscillospiraceae bacterium]